MKPLKLEEISTLIKEQIKKYEKVIITALSGSNGTFTGWMWRI